MVRISVSDLEAIRYYKESEDADFDGLLRRLARAEPPSRKMQAGHALAEFFEHAPEGDLDVGRADGWEFTFNLAAAINVPPVREFKVEIPFLTPSGPVTLVGRCDGLDGVTVRDQKLTEKLDAENYTPSLQWRAYLVMFGAQRFIYDIFVGRISETESRATISEYHPLAFWRYPGIETDVQIAVNEAADIYTRFATQIAALTKGEART